MPDFKGFPPQWTFVILNEPIGPRTTAEDVLDKAEQFLNAIEHRTLIMLIADDEQVKLHDRFGRFDRPVFCLEHAELPKKIEERRPRDAPFVIAVRRKLPANAMALPYSPYLRKKPVVDWRFFGRERELRELVDGDDNIIVIGGRRIGKTSLMQEAVRQIKRRGENAFFVSVQELKTKDQVTRSILQQISTRDAVAAQRQSDLLYENVLASALKRLTRAPRRSTILLDEISNVFDQKPADEWSIFGAFRNYAQAGSLRVVVSCFSEDFHRQVLDYAGPFVNFGRVIRLGVFAEEEMREMLLSPIEFLRPLSVTDRDRLVMLVDNALGGHPLLLQYFCQALSETIVGGRRAHSLVENADWILNDRRALVACFNDPVDEIFYHQRWALLQYVFLAKCHESASKLHSAVIDDDWLEDALQRCGYSSTVNDRRNILDNLEMHGLCSAVNQDRRRQAISAPIIYHYVRQTEQSVDGLLEKYRQDLAQEASVWGLRPTSATTRRHEL
jgi:hypothetical protein